jgi:hypothetical protein
MVNRKWKLFEYEYDIVEFIISFVLAFFVGYFALVSFASAFSITEVVAVDFIWALVVGTAWTYSRAHGLFSAMDKASEKR